MRFSSSTPVPHHFAMFPLLSCSGARCGRTIAKFPAARRTRMSFDRSPVIHCFGPLGDGLDRSSGLTTHSAATNPIDPTLIDEIDDEIDGFAARLIPESRALRLRETFAGVAP